MREIRYFILEAMLAELRRQTGGDFFRDGVHVPPPRARKIDMDLVVDAMLDAIASELPETKNLMDQIKAGTFSERAAEEIRARRKG